MPKIALTQSFIDTVTCPKDKKRVDYFDTRLIGLVMKVLPSGRKSYYVRYNDSHYRIREKRFADASILPLTDARTQAREFLAKLSLGDDPFLEQAKRREIMQYREYIEQRYLPYMQTHKRSWKVDEVHLRLHILPVIGRFYMDDIGKEQAFSLLRRHHKQGYKPSSTNRMLNVAHRTFSCALEWDIAGVEFNPIAAVKKLRENNLRDRYLSNEELQRLLVELNRSEHPRIREIITMLLLTGARRNEVLQAKWSDMDFQKRIWRIEFNKSGVTRYVPLSSGVIDLLRGIEMRSDVDHIFYNPKTLLPYVNIFPIWKRIRQLADIPDVRLHDLRHSYASFLVNQGRSIYEVQKILGHSNVKTTQRYAHLSNETLLDATNSVSEYVAQMSYRTPLKPITETLTLA